MGHLRKSYWNFSRREAAPLAIAGFMGICLGLLAPYRSLAGAAQNPAVATFLKEVEPILEEHCYECHGDGHNKGHIAFDELQSDEEILGPDLWLKVLNNTRAGLMPAEQKPRLGTAEQQMLERWIKYGVFKIDPHNPDPGRVTIRRLNRTEYRNSVRDLLGVDFDVDTEFPPDDTGYGFDNIGDVLTISPMLMEKYVAAAQAIVAQAVPTVAKKPTEQTIRGSAFKGSVPPRKDGTLRLSYYDAASEAASVAVQSPGSYRVILDLEVAGSFDFDPGRTKVVFKVDGRQVLNKEFGYYNDKSFSFDSLGLWKPGEHGLTLEFEPLRSADKKLNPLDIIVRKVTIQGPLEEDRWVTQPGYARFFPRPIPQDRAAQRVYARELLGAFAAKAYRRPLNDDTAKRLAAMAEATYRQRGKSFEQGVVQAMAAVLTSPRFLFRLEEPVPHGLNAKISNVDEYSLASRLSYFLWSTMPDSELMELAAHGELRRNLAVQVKRMLADPRSINLAQNFAGQWLQTRDVDGVASDARTILARDSGDEKELRAGLAAFQNRNLDPKILADFRQKFGKPKMELDYATRQAIRRETEMFFANLVHEDRPVTELIDSDYTFVNDRLATLYGLSDVSGSEMRKITLPAGSPRGGVLTQASSLIVTSNPDRTSPVKRGLFVLTNFLGIPPPPPPANVPALEASEKGIVGHDPTLRESLQLHRADPLCASCHNRMDPIGLAFENFNAMGMWRETERKQPIQAAGKLITGESFNSISELKHILATGHRQDFYRTLVGKLLTYAVGRGLEYYDVETIDQIVRQLNDNEGHFSALLMGIVESAPFQEMRNETSATVSN
jgi:Protein of unknown function (DUF1592)/Protein of unknown function (DUF1588)/Protein of unknown function (DUF1587)/Protein of unknown function (DUF1585)/Protein of unknown function (DUF1595)